MCVYPREFMTLRVAQFSLKIAHLSFSMVLRGPRACGLRPRLWLLGVDDINSHTQIFSLYEVAKWDGTKIESAKLWDVMRYLERA